MNTLYVRTSGTAIASLIFGVLAWVALPLLGAILAVILGHIARGEIRRAPPGSIDGDGMAVAGLVLGYVHLALAALVIALIAMVGMFAIAAWFGHFLA
ncbi:MAG: DUF4190 domain-containing protein [Pseudomonadota bacterium]|uniref:DUF4190 domain-containing protein n=1 Tax=Metallibacterium scheffleri TaxID=993689 RepID=A0A4S3KJD7_9GAMM|nr:DUF4190 domain-containing protein [Metallibacterium scheffleri]MDE3140425.1 DUF4190 domain-containing protein [Pseudomonadota bacterium]THD08094.1 hypothetical protein B1806_13590 [Metallibacterium scheffleri]